MPRDIVLGNGELLVNLDRHLSIRDIYYPYVGWANHVGGYRCRIGVWTGEGKFSWLDDSWDWRINYEDATLVTHCTARSGDLGLLLTFNHAVAHDRNLFLQRITIENLHETSREVRVFLAHDLRIDESDIGDTAFYYPYEDAMVHYKRDRYFLFAGYVGDACEAENVGIFQYACGEKGFRGAEGTWRDAEDGLLSMNAMAQGSVDSVASHSLHVSGRGRETLRTWMAAAANLEAATALHAPMKTEFEETMRQTGVYWKAYGDRRDDLAKLPPRVAELFVRSILIMRTQCDKRGAILASNDSDIMETARAHYSYMWPRDGALASAALDKIGVEEITKPFFEFCARVLPKNPAALLHKYGPDGTVGASWHPYATPDGGRETPIQEDGTALVVWSLWRHFEKYKDTEFAARLYESFVKPASDFMASYRYADSKLPLPSWDLWEERRGTHIYTTATVCAALSASARFAEIFGHDADRLRYQTAAEEIKEAILTHFWDDGVRHFARMITVRPDGSMEKDWAVDASSYSVFAFGVLPASDPHVVANMEAIGRKLWVRAGVGGVARYERDYYFHVTDDFDKIPGNPWIICTLWLADWYIATAKSPSDLSGALDLLEWVGICAQRTGILSEQVHPFSLEPLSVAPLTWSHAQFVDTVTAYLDTLSRLKVSNKG
ncbi:glucan 1,3-alpha-glucosidase [Capsulimonas corticalis]|uniref:Glucan 1,3-alpha-glucosidase n=1 Tax=Capsulimonas corticalis TaxID=2219043 RepID=A0A402CPP5_9BACT|nr:glycoside hydrolase family 15 protein [Capsulimonas corticalis]BDI32938.1 glucan 1,3-alpha-glucosidase [Capsulimonas corticalis]